MSIVFEITSTGDEKNTLKNSLAFGIHKYLVEKGIFGSEKHVLSTLLEIA